MENRRKELAELESSHSRRISDVKKSIELVRNDNIALQRQKLALEGDIASLQHDHELLNERKVSINQHLKEADTSLAEKTRLSERIEARVQFLEGGIAPLMEEQESLKKSIATLEDRRDDLEGKISALSSEYESKKEAAEQDIAQLLAKHQQLDLAHAAMLNDYNKMSEDIAVRTKVLDEREVILKRREYKVDQDERRVAKNAGLLQL